MKKEIAAVSIILVVTSALVSALLLAGASPYNEDFQKRRTRVLGELSSAIEDAENAGLYDCCIEPPCTMCYLGNWIWKDGVCRCDEMIAQGKFDQVCPQCLKGLDGGSCKSAGEASSPSGL